MDHAASGNVVEESNEDKSVPAAAAAGDIADKEESSVDSCQHLQVKQGEKRENRARARAQASSSNDSNPTTDDEAWHGELAEALDEECGLYDVCRVAEGRVFPDHLRIRAWLACLDVSADSEKTSLTLGGWDGTFNLPSQEILRRDCQDLVAQVGVNVDTEKLALLNNVESVITAVCWQKKCDYDANCGWIGVLRTLARLKMPLNCLHDLFLAILHKFIPKDAPKNEVVYPLFRLVVLYHDPELCSFIDSNKISFERFSSTWFSTLLSDICQPKTIYAIWDIYFQNNDPFLVLFLGLVLLLTKREELLDMKIASRNEICEFLRCIPSHMSLDDVVDFYQVANNYLALTPLSLRETNCTTLFGSRPVSPSKRLHIPIPQALCLPVTIDELVSSPHKTLGCRFFAVDCRPPEQYNAGHLVTAFHLDAQLLIQDKSAFDVAVGRLLACQKEALQSNSISGGEHLCFIGSGFEAEDQFVHMVIARMLQKNHKFVSMADGGHEALLYYIEVNSLEANRILAGSDVENFAAKSRARQQEKSGQKVVSEGRSLFGRLTSAVKSQLPIVKDKITTYITNSGSSSSSTPIRHISAHDRSRKHYRPSTNVFVFDDEEDDFGDDGVDYPEGEPQNWKEFVRRPDVLAHFECLEYVTTEEAVPALLVISETDIYNFRMSTENPDMATLVAQHGLSEVLKIVCRKKIPELITIKYGNMEDGIPTVHDIERYYISKSGDAIKVIKLQVLKVMAEDGHPVGEGVV